MSFWSPIPDLDYLGEQASELAEAAEKMNVSIQNPIPIPKAGIDLFALISFGKNVELSLVTQILESLTKGDYQGILQKVKQLFFESDPKKIYQTVSQLEYAFGAGRFALTDPLTLLRVEDMHGDLVLLKREAGKLFASSSDDESRDNFEATMKEIEEKLESSSYADSFIKELGLSQDDIAKSMIVTKNEDGTVRISWKNS